MHTYGDPGLACLLAAVRAVPEHCKVSARRWLLRAAMPLEWDKTELAALAKVVEEWCQVRAHRCFEIDRTPFTPKRSSHMNLARGKPARRMHTSGSQR